MTQNTLTLDISYRNPRGRLRGKIMIENILMFIYLYILNRKLRGRLYSELITDVCDFYILNRKI